MGVGVGYVFDTLVRGRARCVGGPPNGQAHRLATCTASGSQPPGGGALERRRPARGRRPGAARHCGYESVWDMMSRQTVKVWEPPSTTWVKSHWSWPRGRPHVLWHAKSCLTGPRGCLGHSGLPSLMDM